MKTISQLNISTRLWLLIGVMALLQFAIGSVGLIGIGKSNDALKTVYEDRTVVAGQIAEISYLVQRNRVLVMDMLLVNAASNVDKRSKELQDNISRVNRIWDDYMATQLTPDEEVLAKQLAARRAAYVNEAMLPAVLAVNEGRTEDAGALYRSKISPIAHEVQQLSDKLMKLQLDVAKSEYEAALDRYATLQIVAAVSIASGIAAAVLFGYALIRNISAAMAEAIEGANAVASGDLAITIQSEGQNEVAKMLQAMDRMKSKLAEVVGTVRQNAESVATASAQIAQGNQDLSQRTEEQASALQQTSATMMQLDSTVRNNAGHAQQANQLAQAASGVAIKGGEIVGRVVHTMTEISESSRRISDIISTIDGIAFQTNILALNAAVEAARAGEQGRGFAVVAGEVRALAQRSAEAAKEIKGLIGTSVDRVERGTELVSQAGATMADVVQSIRQVSDIVAEISSASSEQSTIVGQVREAVGQMDQVTQQNAALVEESAAAAESLKLQAGSLVQAVGIFKLAAS